MKKRKAAQIVRHGIEFLILLVIFALGLGGLLYFKFDTASQIAVVLLMAVFYVFWGILHHILDGDLVDKIILEYFGISALVSTILIIFLLRL